MAEALYEIIIRQSQGRFGLSSGSYDYDILSRIARNQFPELDEKGVIPHGIEQGKGVTVSEQGVFGVDASRAEKELGIKCES